jgi:hypothetical protein
MVTSFKPMLIGAALADGALLALAAIQATPLPGFETFGAAGVTGAATSLAVLWAWKATTDKRLEKIENDKASKDDLVPLHEALREIKDDVRYLVRSNRTSTGE